MVARINTVAFSGIEVLAVDVQVQMASGLPAFTIVGLPDKAVAESRERVRAALGAIALALPPKRITINLAPADLQKEGSHYDLPIALGLLAAMGVIDGLELADYVVLGELALDGRIAPVHGVLPAAIAANGEGRGLICPQSCGSEAAFSGNDLLLAPDSLLSLINHFKGSQILGPPEPAPFDDASAKGIDAPPDLADIKGQETAKRALEIAATGGHNLLMTGPPGAGKSMLAARLPGLLPPLSPSEVLETSMIHSIAGELRGGVLSRQRAFRAPHHSASLPALVGGGAKARPGEITLAHLGVLFLDELPEFSRNTLEALRQPIESGSTLVARANAHITYPARFQLIAAMNPCRCGYLDDATRPCSRVPKCANDYQSKISGPLFDRIDLHIEVPAVPAGDLTLPPPGEGTKEVAARVLAARKRQEARFSAIFEENGRSDSAPDIPRCNAEADGKLLEEIAKPDPEGVALLNQAVDKMKLSARGYHRVLRVGRTLADLDGEKGVRRPHIAESLSYRRLFPGQYGGL